MVAMTEEIKFYEGTVKTAMYKHQVIAPKGSMTIEVCEKHHKKDCNFVRAGIDRAGTAEFPDETKRYCTSFCSSLSTSGCIVCLQEKELEDVLRQIHWMRALTKGILKQAEVAPGGESGWAARGAKIAATWLRDAADLLEDQEGAKLLEENGNKEMTREHG